MVIRGKQIAGVHGNGASKEYQTNELHTHESFYFCLLLLLLALVAPVARAHSVNSLASVCWGKCWRVGVLRSCSLVQWNPFTFFYRCASPNLYGYIVSIFILIVQTATKYIGQYCYEVPRQLHVLVYSCSSYNVIFVRFNIMQLVRTCERA